MNCPDCGTPISNEYGNCKRCNARQSQKSVNQRNPIRQHNKRAFSTLDIILTIIYMILMMGIIIVEVMINNPTKISLMMMLGIILVSFFIFGIWLKSQRMT